MSTLPSTHTTARVPSRMLTTRDSRLTTHLRLSSQQPRPTITNMNMNKFKNINENKQVRVAEIHNEAAARPNREFTNVNLSSLDLR